MITLLILKKGSLPSKELSPWFNLLEEDSLAPNEYIVFGHWASLNGQTNIKNIIGLIRVALGRKPYCFKIRGYENFSVQKNENISSWRIYQG